jgi:hypothetical protein
LIDFSYFILDMTGLMDTLFSTLYQDTTTTMAHLLTRPLSESDSVAANAIQDMPNPNHQSHDLMRVSSLFVQPKMESNDTVQMDALSPSLMENMLPSVVHSNTVHPSMCHVDDVGKHTPCIDNRNHTQDNSQVHDDEFGSTTSSSDFYYDDAGDMDTMTKHVNHLCSGKRRQRCSSPAEYEGVVCKTEDDDASDAASDHSCRKQTRIKYTTSTAASDLPRRSKRGRRQHSTFATNTLRYWLAANAHHPYPTPEEKRALCQITGLGMTQLNDWFVNARRRVLPRGRSSILPQLPTCYFPTFHPPFNAGWSGASDPTPIYGARSSLPIMPSPLPHHHHLITDPNAAATAYTTLSHDHHSAAGLPSNPDPYHVLSAKLHLPTTGITPAQAAALAAASCPRWTETVLPSSTSTPTASTLPSTLANAMPSTVSNGVDGTRSTDDVPGPMLPGTTPLPNHAATFADTVSCLWSTLK